MCKVDFTLPILFSDNKNEEGKKACHALQKAGIPFEYPPSVESTPILLVDLTRYVGLQKIEWFVKSKKAQETKEKYKHKI